MIDLYNPKSSKAEEFINHEEILSTLAYADEHKHDKALITEILAKAKLEKGLSHREASVLLACDIPELNKEIFALAKKLKMIFMAIELFYSRHFIFLITVLMDVYIALIMLKINILLEKINSRRYQTRSYRPSRYGTQTPCFRNRRRPSK